MKTISYTAGYHARTLIYQNNAQADEAYAILKKAISEYNEYGNDKTKSVTIQHGTGEVSIRFGLNGLSDACISSMDDEEVAAMVEYGTFRNRISKAIKASPTPRGRRGSGGLKARSA